MKSLHRAWNHKSAANMLNYYRKSNAEDMKGLTKSVEEVIKRCHVCQVHTKSFSVPKVSPMIPKRINYVLMIDLKFFSGIPVLWMMDTLSRYAMGRVLKNKEAEEVAKALQSSWLCTFGRPHTGIWSDNGKEFANEVMYWLAKKWGYSMKFGPPYSQFSNRLNERNHKSSTIFRLNSLTS